MVPSLTLTALDRGRIVDCVQYHMRSVCVSMLIMNIPTKHFEYISGIFIKGGGSKNKQRFLFTRHDFFQNYFEKLRVFRKPLRLICFAKLGWRVSLS